MKADHLSSVLVVVNVNAKLILDGGNILFERTLAVCVFFLKPALRRKIKELRYLMYSTTQISALQ